MVHTLSISQEAITAVSFNQRGDWLAIGSAALGQLLVWEWRSETYILKQQGHFHDISTVAYSPDGAYIATGAADAKVSTLASHFAASGRQLTFPSFWRFRNASWLLLLT